MNKMETVQASLNGVWRDKVNGCPHIHKIRDSVDLCDDRKMSPCIYETGDGPCELFLEILEEWTRELEVCGECGEILFIPEEPSDLFIHDHLVKQGMAPAENIYFHVDCVPSFCRRILQDWERAKEGK